MTKLIVLFASISCFTSSLIGQNEGDIVRVSKDIIGIVYKPNEEKPINKVVSRRNDTININRISDLLDSVDVNVVNSTNIIRYSFKDLKNSLLIKRDEKENYNCDCEHYILHPDVYKFKFGCYIEDELVYNVNIVDGVKHITGRPYNSISCARDETITVRVFTTTGSANSDRYFETPMQKGEIFRASLNTVPYKVRRATNTANSSASSGVSNIGFQGILFPRFKNEKTNKIKGINRRTKYLYDGRVKSHRWGLSVYLAPTVEEFEITSGENTGKYSSLLFSSALGIVYSYNDIMFAFYPLGVDVPVSRKANLYPYRVGKSTWYGIGIGLNLKSFKKLAK